MTGEWLAFCGTCPVPEIANVFRRSGIPFHPITGTLEDDPDCWNEVDDWIAAAKVVSGMFHNRLGIMGHYYGGMLDIYTDLTLQCSTFGGHMEILEVDELVALRREVGASEAKERVSLFQDSFYIQPDCSEGGPYVRRARSSRGAPCPRLHGLLLVQSRREAVWIDFKAFGFFLPARTDELIRGEASESLEAFGKIIGVEERAEMLT